jgi:cellobiose-specific phosphotransferase system component IIA
MMTELLQLEQIQEEHHQMMYMLHQEETEEQQLGQLLMMNIEDHLLIQSLMKPSEEVQLTLREAQ